MRRGNNVGSNRQERKASLISLRGELEFWLHNKITRSTNARDDQVHVLRDEILSLLCNRVKGFYFAILLLLSEQEEVYFLLLLQSASYFISALKTLFADREFEYQ